MPRRKVTKVEDPYEAAMWAARDKRYKWLREHRLFHAIAARTLQGWGAHRLARYVQDQVPPEDILHRTKVTEDALAERFKRFRRKIPTHMFLPRAYLDEVLTQADAEIDVLRELAALIVYQKKRIDLLREREVSMGMPIEQQRREIDTMLNLLMRARDTMMGLGVLPGTPPSEVNVTMRGDGGGTAIGDYAETRLERYLRENPQSVGDVVKMLGDLPIEGEWHEVAEGVPDAERAHVPRLPGDGSGGVRGPEEAP